MLRNLEEQVLNALDFQLAVPTVLDFVNTFLERIRPPPDGVGGKPKDCYLPRDTIGAMTVTEEAAVLARYMAELSLQEPSLVVKLPSLVGGACLVLALHYVDLPVFAPPFALLGGRSAL